MSDWFAGSPAVAVSRAPLPVRRFKRPFMMLTATTVFVAGSCTSEQPAAAPDAPAKPPHVVFYAEGEGTASGAVTFLSESGGTIQKDVALPMVDLSTNTPGISSDKFERGAALSMSIQNRERSGSVTCRIEVDGKVVDEATSTGAFKVVSCVGKVP